MDIPVKHTKCNYWHTGEYDIVKLNIPLIKDSHGTKSAKVSIEVVRHGKRNILVEEIEYELRDA